MKALKCDVFWRPLCVASLLVDVLSLPLSAGTVAPEPFTKITSGSIVNDFGNSFVAEWGDYDNDGLLDLFVGNAYGPTTYTPYLYRNNGDGTFTKITTAPFVNEPGNIGAWGDFDNDGNLDLFVGNAFGKNSLYRNNGDGTFMRITGGSIVNDIAIAQSCSWVDFDNDGFLDLFVVNGGGAASENNFLYHNNGDGTFTRVTSGSIANDSGFGVGSAWADYDNDGYLDVFVANLSGKNALYHNQRDGTFTRITQGDIANDVAAGSGCAWGDYDNDGFPDLFVANGGDLNNFLYHNNGDGTFTKITTGNIVNDRGYSVGAAWADYDNDGYLDLFVANRLGNNFLYHNNGDGTFAKITTGAIVSEAADSNGVAWGDYNNDGFLDLFVANWNNEQNFLYLNNGNTNNWIKVRCVGTTSNRSGVGAKVKVQARFGGNSRWQLRQIGGFDSFGSTSLDAHFGLGEATNIDTVRIEWPSGLVQELNDVAVKQTLTMTEPGIIPFPPPSSALQIIPDSRIFTNSIYILMETTNTLAVIRYSLDNAAPSSNSPAYTQPVRLTNTTILQAQLFYSPEDRFPISDIVLATFVAGNALPDLQFLPETTLFTNSIKVELQSNLGFGVIRFTVDGTEPLFNSPAYLTPIKLNELATIKARIFAQNNPISDVIGMTYTRVYAINDGIPAAWREGYFGPGYLTDPRVAADADPDGDGANNWEEYIAGTDPTDPLSILKASVRAVPLIAWTSISNKIYRVVRKDSVTSTNWVTILDDFHATNSISTFIDTEVANAASYYAVEAIP